MKLQSIIHQKKIVDDKYEILLEFGYSMNEYGEEMDVILSNKKISHGANPCSTS